MKNYTLINTKTKKEILSTKDYHIALLALDKLEKRNMDTYYTITVNIGV